MKIEFDWPESVPLDHIDTQFIQGMLDRMAVGFHNYGHSRRYEHVPHSLQNVMIRLAKYAGLTEVQRIVDVLASMDIDLRRTANTEFLIDAANYAMMEFMRPSLPDAKFQSTTKDDSPGAIVDGRHVKGKEHYPKPRRTPREGD